jgi:hypothetical protein
MRFNFATLLLLILSTAPLSAAPPPADLGTLRSAQIQAAKDEAIDNLRTQLSQANLNPSDLSTVKPIGGPRWIDDHTCQMQLEFTAQNKQTFTAVGSSVAGDQIASARPLDPQSPWSAVDEASRKTAIAAAQLDAINHLLDRFSSTPLATALDRPEIHPRLIEFLRQEPVTKVEFADDLSVSLTIRPFADSVVSTLHTLLDGPNSKIDWKMIEPIVGHLGPAVGRAVAVYASVGSSPPLRQEPPDWVNQQLQADATAAGNAAPLKIARTAETAAIAKLRAQFLSLRISPATTLSDALRAQPSMAAAVDRAMQHAHTFKVDYRADGSVLVRVTLDLRDAWNELRSNP